MRSKPNNKAVIPAAVRFSPTLLAAEKLLYGEIVALCGRNGHCWPRNSYFAGLYGRSTKTVSRWLKKLERHGLIRLTVNREMFDRREIHLPAPNGASAGGGPDTGVRGAGHACPPKAGALLIVEKNDSINDESECGTRPPVHLVSFSFSNGAAPTVGQVRERMESLAPGKSPGLDLDQEAARFHTHYTANGWMMGSARMRDLSAAAEKWLQNTVKFNPNSKTQNEKAIRVNAKHNPSGHLHSGRYEGTGF